MFDYTSAYNSPVNAVQRYKDAGLNPNLLTGQVVTEKNKSNLLSEQAITEVAKRLNISYDNMVKINTAINLADENKNIKATYKEIISRVGLNKANTAILSLQAEKMRIEKPMWHSEAYNRCSLIMQQAAQYGKITDAQINELKEQARLFKNEAQYYKNKFGATDYTGLVNYIDDFQQWLFAMFNN